jgi:hypothetical protein
VADSSSTRHLTQDGLSVKPSEIVCFRWQCPVSSPTTHLNWSLFNFNRSFVLLAEGPDISPFACLSLIVNSQFLSSVSIVDGSLSLDNIGIASVSLIHDFLSVENSHGSNI